VIVIGRVGLLLEFFKRSIFLELFHIVGEIGFFLFDLLFLHGSRGAREGSGSRLIRMARVMGRFIVYLFLDSLFFRFCRRTSEHGGNVHLFQPV